MPRLPLALLLALVPACASPGPVRDVRGPALRPVGPRVALAVDGLALADVLAQVRAATGVEVHVDSRVRGTVTLTHDEAPVDFSLRWIAAEVGARVTRRAGEVWLVPLSDEAFAPPRRPALDR